MFRSYLPAIALLLTTACSGAYDADSNENASSTTGALQTAPISSAIQSSGTLESVSTEAVRQNPCSKTCRKACKPRGVGYCIADEHGSCTVKCDDGSDEFSSALQIDSSGN